MNRTFFVAALATLASGAAMAQSNVTVYGRLNLTLEQVNLNGTKVKKENNNSSRIGFKGTEDIGGGLKAGFVLESGLSPDTGAAAASFWGRQSEVNLGGGFGTVRLGNFVSEAYFATADYISMHNHDTGDSGDALYAYVGRNTNKVAYRAPEFVKGLSLEGAVSAAESSTRIKTYDFAANYSLGALALGLGYEKAGTPTLSQKQFAVRALYDFGSLVVGGYLQRDTNGWGAGDRTTFRLSGAYMMGASEFHLNVGKAGKYSNTANSDATQFTAGYNYALSKRTKVYGYFTEVKDGSANLYNSGNFGIASTGSSTKFSAIAGGIRHNF
jgi:predicted porin